MIRRIYARLFVCAKWGHNSATIRGAMYRCIRCGGDVRERKWRAYN